MSREVISADSGSARQLQGPTSTAPTTGASLAAPTLGAPVETDTSGAGTITVVDNTVTFDVLANTAHNNGSSGALYARMDWGLANDHAPDEVVDGYVFEADLVVRAGFNTQFSAVGLGLGPDTLANAVFFGVFQSTAGAYSAFAVVAGNSIGTFDGTPTATVPAKIRASVLVGRTYSTAPTTFDVKVQLLDSDGAVISEFVRQFLNQSPAGTALGNLWVLHHESSTGGPASDIDLANIMMAKVVLS